MVNAAYNAFYKNAILLSGAKFPPFFFADLIVLSNFADRSRKYEVPWVSLSIRSPILFHEGDRRV